MRWIWTSVTVVGVVVAALGVLWFLQGSDLVRIDPIACVADCEPIAGHQPGWQLAGAVAVLIGALATSAAIKKLRAAQKHAAR